MHNIEQYGDQAAFVSARVPAWHRLGTVTPEALTAEEATRIAHLGDWNVRKEPMFTGSGSYVPAKVATVRTNPFTGDPEVLGVVGKDYKIIQNEEAFEVLDQIVDESGAHFETAGSLGHGNKVFMTMKMPDGILVAGEDAADLYLIATTAHDGTAAFTLAVTPIRVVCQNTLTIGLGRAKQKWTLRHTSNVAGRIQEARESLQLTYAYADIFSQEMSALLDQSFTDEQFAQLTAELVPESQSEHEGWQQQVIDKRAQLTQLFCEADTQEFGRGTKYAALNAVTEWADWYLPVKGDDTGGVKRATRLMDGGVVQQIKSKAYAALV